MAQATVSNIHNTWQISEWRYQLGTSVRLSNESRILMPLVRGEQWGLSTYHLFQGDWYSESHFPTKPQLPYRPLRHSVLWGGSAQHNVDGPFSERTNSQEPPSLSENGSITRNRNLCEKVGIVYLSGMVGGKLFENSQNFNLKLNRSRTSFFLSHLYKNSPDVRSRVDHKFQRNSIRTLERGCSNHYVLCSRFRRR